LSKPQQVSLQEIPGVVGLPDLVMADDQRVIGLGQVPGIGRLEEGCVAERGSLVHSCAPQAVASAAVQAIGADQVVLAIGMLRVVEVAVADVVLEIEGPIDIVLKHAAVGLDKIHSTTAAHYCILAPENMLALGSMRSLSAARVSARSMSAMADCPPWERVVVVVVVVFGLHHLEVEEAVAAWPQHGTEAADPDYN
jgi:hypothetical protein